MKRYAVPYCAGGLFGLLCCLCCFVHAGPSHDAAMAVVHNGETISNTGNLDAAMAEYDRVEGLYPEEFEAIAWARFRKAECLIAGWRWDEALDTMRSAWDRIQDGSITDPDAKFWCTMRYARCIEHTGNYWYLAQVAGKGLEFYQALEEPGGGMEEASGWLHYWRSRHFSGKGQHAWARTEAEQAWEVAKRVGNGTLAAWSRLMVADSLRGEGNLILAHQILKECDESFAQHEDATYRLYLGASRAETGLDLGLTEDTRNQVMEALVDQIGDPALRIRAALVYVDDALQRGATAEVLVPLAVIRSSIRHTALWGDQAEDRWQRIRGRTPESLFAAALADIDSHGLTSQVEQAAVKIQLADCLRSLGRIDEAIPTLAAAKALDADGRYDVAIRFAEAACRSGEDPTAVRTTVETIVREKATNPELIEHLLSGVRPEMWETEEHPNYGEWLDTLKPSLPGNVYLTEKGRWLRERENDTAAALSAADSVLSSADPWNRFEAHVDKIIALSLLDRDSEADAAVEAFLAETHDQGIRNYGLFLAENGLRDRDRDACMKLLDRLLASTDKDIWVQEGMVDKGYLLYADNRDDEAKALLEELISYPPLEGNGGQSIGFGMALLARLYDRHLGDVETAKQYYEMVIDASESMRFAQSYTYNQYLGMLYRKGMDDDVLRVCELGSQRLPQTSNEDRAMVELWRCKARFRKGEMEEAVNAATGLLDSGVSQSLASRIESWLNKASTRLQTTIEEREGQ